MKPGGLAGLVIALALLTSGATQAQAQDDAAVVCQRVKALRGEASRSLARGSTVGVTADQEARLRRPRTLCLPAAPAGQTAPAPATGLQSWELEVARTDARGGRYGETLALETSLGDVAGRLQALTRLLTPVGVALGDGGADAPTPAADALACHRLRGSGAGAAVSLVSAIGRFDLRLDAARAVCLPNGAAGPRWVCHRTRLGRGARAPRGTLVSTNGAFGAAVLRLGPVADVCVRARGADPGVTLRIEPDAQEIEWRATADFRVVAERPDGSREDVTDRVTWTVADEAIAALAENPPAPGRLFGREPGTTALTAVDPVTGAEAVATLTVAWTLERIEIAPQQVNRVVGQHETFQATGFFASGASHNVTPRLAWSSSDPAIASAGGPPPSRMTAAGFGTATISACDPRTGICAADDATMIVFGGLQSLEVFPQTIQSILPGGSVRFSARGNYADGRRRNLTQRVEWISETPGVARALNEDGDRSRIDGLVPGIATIRARDPQTGFQSFPYTLYVLGGLVDIDAYPTDSLGDAVRAPGSRRYTAIGRYAGGGTRNLTQDLVWHSRNPSIGVTPNAAGDRSRVDSAGASGTAAIWAEDPATGLVSNDVVFRVLGELSALGIDPSHRRRPPPFNRVPVGAALRYNVSGVFSTGERLNFPRFFPEGYTLVSSDPGIAEVVERNQVRGVGVGSVMIHAVDLASGVTSPAQELLVQGALERLFAHVFFTKLIVGGQTVADAKGHFPPGIEVAFRGPLVFASSDPSVVTVESHPNGRATVRAVGPGTATVSATDPATGVSSSTTGDNAVVTVFPSMPPVRIVITPPVATIAVDGFEGFTATAEFFTGQTVNVTQLATWTSSTPGVAALAPHLAQGQSRVLGVAGGVAQIRAEWQGITSTATGHDAVALVSPVTAFTVLGTDTPLAVGAEREMRVKVRLASGRELDVTSQLEYAALDVGIADFLDDELPNRVTGIGPGTVDLDLGFPGSTARTSASLTVVDDVPATTTTTTATTTTTTTTLPGGAPLVLEPAAQTVDFGQTAHFRARRGGTDVSDAVEWSVVDASIAGAVGGAVTTRDPGTTTVQARDPQTGGVASATLTVDWSLRRITLWPRQANRAVGDWERFQALGTFKRGGTVAITERLQYESSDPAVAALRSGEDTPSEVVATGMGVAVVSACDPISGACSGDSGGNATLLVGGGLQAITIAPGWPVSRFPGTFEQYTATGHFDDGSTQDLTQVVTWSVDNAPLAQASNVAGTRGRVYALAPGLTSVRATDPDTGIQATATPLFYTLGPIQEIWLGGIDPIQMGQATRPGAWALHQGGGQRNVTHEVEWGSQDPAIAAATNPAGDRNRIDGVGVGTTGITARDPATGVVSSPSPLLVYGDLVSLHVRLLGQAQIGIGARLGIRVDGCFAGGWCENLTRAGLPYDLVSSDPGVLAVEAGSNVRGIAGGTATVTATGPGGTPVSAPIPITVQGVLARLALSPAAVTRAIGETQAYTAIGHYPPGITGLVTQDVVWASSDPAVAVATNEPGNRSRIVAVGPGTTTISATDPVTGVRSTDTGDDVTLTVLPGQLDRIVVSPPFVRRMAGQTEEFTATGFYPDGSSLNVTQQVEWTTSASSVAGAFGPPNRKSLFQATGPGVALIGAVHPQGVRSSDSGHDALMEVDAVTALAISPSSRTLAVGQSEEFTVTATLASGGTVNVTQQADYGRQPFFTTVVGVPSLPPRKSRVTALAPGQAQVVAFFGNRTAGATITVPGGSPSGAFLE